MTNKIEILKKIREKATPEMLAKIRSKQYFSEDNALNTIEKMEKSGLGRTGHRNLARKLRMTWNDYKIALDIIKNPDKNEIAEEKETQKKIKNAA